VLAFNLFASRIKSQSNLLKNDWEAERCKPYIIPFAGIINGQNGEQGQYKELLHFSQKLCLVI
jgi:hypothetical protein